MSSLRKRWVLFSHPHANIVFQGPVHIGPGFSLYMPHPGATLIVGPDVEFRRGFRAEVSGAGKIAIGARCILSYYTLIQCTGYIEIGECCPLGQPCAIFDGNHNYKGLDVPFVGRAFELRPIRIGKECGVLAKTDRHAAPAVQPERVPSEIADRPLRGEVIRRLMLGDVLPIMQEGPAGTAVGLNVQWTLGGATMAG